MVHNEICGPEIPNIRRNETLDILPTGQARIPSAIAIEHNIAQFWNPDNHRNDSPTYTREDLLNYSAVTDGIPKKEVLEKLNTDELNFVYRLLKEENTVCAIELSKNPQHMRRDDHSRATDLFIKTAALTREQYKNTHTVIERRAFKKTEEDIKKNKNWHKVWINELQTLTPQYDPNDENTIIKWSIEVPADYKIIDCSE